MEQVNIKQLAQNVYDYCGLNYIDNLASFELKVMKRMTQLELSNIEVYRSYLLLHEEEWHALVEVLTINETYFYREDKQLNVFQKYLLPQLQENREINVWSAACSTGEEPYSLAIMSKAQHAAFLEKIKITATDINKKVLKIACKGLYNKKSLSFRRIPTTWLTTDFEETNDAYIVSQEIKNCIQFEYFNLMMPLPQAWQQKYDVIFCRNVLIYFDEATIEKVVMTFYRALKPGGYLFLGHAETITMLKLPFKLHHVDGAFYYQKGFNE